MDYKSILSYIGNQVGVGTQKIISWLGSLGINITPTQAKILDLIIILAIVWLVLKVLTSVKGAVKFLIIILSIILIISIVSSFFIK